MARHSGDSDSGSGRRPRWTDAGAGAAGRYGSGTFTVAASGRATRNLANPTGDRPTRDGHAEHGAGHWHWHWHWHWHER